MLSPHWEVLIAENRKIQPKLSFIILGAARRGFRVVDSITPAGVTLTFQVWIPRHLPSAARELCLPLPFCVCVCARAQTSPGALGTLDFKSFWLKS